ncbi:hypothetical protein F8377_00720 [Corynebacterium zhongnanshanii]|uniref:Uncharacterized protein n=1 Tax=Corynebacterium zhongnanshanii TaxID=2768834 RepID=A0ABQ6VEC3_9CORY|nr:hypothetical protein [Corynebacterium zhongnanshanii]KAB3522739.1 hypothetical protein F8377_00720 [Corynebacterium zhongnanshanii]
MTNSQVLLPHTSTKRLFLTAVALIIIGCANALFFTWLGDSSQLDLYNPISIAAFISALFLFAVAMKRIRDK